MKRAGTERWNASRRLDGSPNLPNVLSIMADNLVNGRFNLTRTSARSTPNIERIRCEGIRCCCCACCLCNLHMLFCRSGPSLDLGELDDDVRTLDCGSGVRRACREAGPTRGHGARGQGQTPEGHERDLSAGA